MKAILRIGVVGCGEVSRVGHGPAIAADPRAMLAACCDPDDHNRRQFVRRFHTPGAYRRLEHMLEEEKLDGVVIAAPPALHAGMVETCAERVPAILCEKPMAVTLDECDRMIAARNRHGVLLQIGHSKRFETGFARIRQWVRTGRIGPVHQVNIAWHYYMPDLHSGFVGWSLDRLLGWRIDLRKKYGTWRLEDPTSGGGDLYDHGPHYFDLLRWILGEIESIYCVTRKLVEGRAHEDMSVSVLTLADGTVVRFEKSCHVVGRPSGFEIGEVYGRKGKIGFEAIQEYRHRPMRLKLYRRRNIVADTWTHVRLPQGRRHTLYFRQMRHFIDRMTGKATLPPPCEGPWAATAEDARLALAWLLAAYHSAEHGVVVRRGDLGSLPQPRPNAGTTQVDRENG
jgi:UDP-N-acetyl-2-amino-2-deoxyglucuronate dehydrogenase